MKIVIGADHAGFNIKEKIKKFLDKKKINYEDLGANSFEQSDDYPDYAEKVARKVAKDNDSKGIVVCGSGMGMAIAANKIKGIRAVCAYDKYTAKMSREHNNANVLCLRGKNFPFWKIKMILHIWLSTEFSGEERHKRRIGKIEKIK